MTDIARDEQRAEVVSKIRKLEADELTKEKAKRLINLWEKYKNIRRGYWTFSSKELADMKIKELKEWLNTNSKD